MTRGAANIGGEKLEAGDGLAVSDETRLEISSDDGAEFLLFDLI